MEALIFILIISWLGFTAYLIGDWVESKGRCGWCWLLAAVFASPLILILVALLPPVNKDEDHQDAETRPGKTA